MSLSTGTRLGPYEIVSPLGAGGMGEVYRARDSRLNRVVALKVLPAALANDADYMARFQREAEVLASLNHPNIATIHVLEEAGVVRALVMELVEGQTLKQRIAGTPLALDEVLDIARQIVDALEAAHEKGIVHRDLKPANVKITPEGVVKVLDFGLAKVTDRRAASGDLSDSPTLTLEATRAGMILGTAAYMSPEQARARAVDKRADIWAFGCMLYELLTGQRAFNGDDISETLASVIKTEPDWSALPSSTPAHIRALMLRCLEKDPKRRLRDIGEARIALLQPAEPVVAPPVQPRRSAQARVAWVLAAILGAIAAGVSVIHFREKPAVAQPVRFAVTPPAQTQFGQSLSVSPDGRRVAFTARDPDGRYRLWVRPLDALEARSLAVTDAVASPFWSPDSQFIAFVSDQKLQKVDISGGQPQTLCDAPPTTLGGAWNRDGVILFGGPGGGIQRVSAAGGVASQVTVVNRSRSENYHAYPSFLADGQHFIYFRSSGRTIEYLGTYVGSLDAKPEQQSLERLLDTFTGAAYVPSSGASVGHVLFLRAATLMAQPFDERRLALAVEPVPIAEQVGVFQTTGYFSASANGVLAYAGGRPGRQQLTWYDRTGKILGRVGSPAAYNDVALSPDAAQVAVADFGREGRSSQGLRSSDILLIESASGATRRFTFHPSINWLPVWSPDGKRILFVSNRAGANGLYWKISSGAEEEQPLLNTGNTKHANDWSRDGRFVLYSELDPKTQSDLWVLPLDGDRKPAPLAATEFNESQGQFSPDGRWIAYTSDESGKSEVYVRPFSTSGQPGGKWAVSVGGGSQARWRRDGKELFYLSSDQKIMSVEISADPSFQALPPRVLFESPISARGTASYRYGVTADGKRFMVVTPADEPASTPITVVLNWTSVR